MNSPVELDDMESDKFMSIESDVVGEKNPV